MKTIPPCPYYQCDYKRQYQACLLNELDGVHDFNDCPIYKEWSEHPEIHDHLIPNSSPRQEIRGGWRA